MTLTINDITITSDQNPHTARLAPGCPHIWQASWLPGEVLDRNSAITAMILADIAGKGDLHQGHRLWPHIESWAAELGLTGPDAIARASQPPRHLVPGQERASQPDTPSRPAGSTGRAGRLPEDATPAPEGTAEDEGLDPGCWRDSPQIRPAPEPEPEAGQ